MLICVAKFVTCGVVSKVAYLLGQATEQQEGRSQSRTCTKSSNRRATGKVHKMHVQSNGGLIDAETHYFQARCFAFSFLQVSLETWRSLTFLQARQDGLQFVIHDLLPLRICRRLVRCVSYGDTHVASAPQQNNIRLPRQSGASADLCVLSTHDSSRHPRGDEFELARSVALCVCNFAEVDIQEDTIGQIRGARVDERGS